MVDKSSTGSTPKGGGNAARIGGVSGPASDIWALGCLLFELLTGVMLFNQADWSSFFVRLTQPELVCVLGRKIVCLHVCGCVWMCTCPWEGPDARACTYRMRAILQCQSCHCCRLICLQGTAEPLLQQQGIRCLESLNRPTQPDLQSAPTSRHVPLIAWSLKLKRNAKAITMLHPGRRLHHADRPCWSSTMRVQWKMRLSLRPAIPAIVCCQGSFFLTRQYGGRRTCSPRPR